MVDVLTGGSDGLQFLKRLDASMMFYSKSGTSSNLPVIG